MAIVRLFDKDGNEYGLSADFKKVYVPQYVLTKEEIETTKFITVEEETTKFKVREVSTTRYVERTEPTIKYILKEVEVEKPVIRRVNLDVPNKASIEIIKDAVDIIVQCIKIIPDLIKNLHLLFDCAKDIPKIRQEFIAMKRMIEGYQRPVFRDVEVVNAVLKDKIVPRPVFKDVEIINPIIRDKPMTIEEAKRASEQVTE